MRECLNGGVSANFCFSEPGRRSIPVLYRAIERKDEKMVRLLLDYGANPDLQGSNGCSSLVATILNDTPELLRHLCEYGADVNLVNHWKNSPLDDSVKRKRLKCAAILKSYGAELSSFHESTVENPELWAPILALLQTNTPDKQPTYGGKVLTDPAQVIAFMKKNPGAETTSFSFFAFAKAGNVAALRALLQNGANPNRPGPGGYFPVVEAAKFGHYNAVGLMLDYGADPTSVNPDKFNIMTYMITGQHGHISEENRLRIATLLLDYGYPFEAENGWGSTALEDACFHRKNKFVELLCSFGAYAAHAKSGKKLRLNSSIQESLKTPPTRTATQTPRYVQHAKKTPDTPESVPVGNTTGIADFAGTSDLHAAAEAGNVNTVLKLVQSGADVLAKDKLQKTPLHILCAKATSPEAFSKILDILFEADPAVLSVKDSTGRFPIHNLCERKNSGALLLTLLKKDPRQVNAVAQSGDKCSPLHLSVKATDKESIILLLKLGAKTTLTDKEGRTPLHYAAENNAAGIAEILLRHDANAINSRDALGRTPFLTACAVYSRYSSPSTVQSQKTILRVLAENGANIKALDRSRQTGMHLAAKNGSEEVVEYLIQLGLNINARDKSGQTPLDVARYGNSRAYELLQRYGAKHGKNRTYSK